MKKSFISVLLLIAAPYFLTGCQTSKAFSEGYGPAGDGNWGHGFGYKDLKLGDNLYAIEYTDKDSFKARIGFRRRATELCGNDAFLATNRREAPFIISGSVTSLITYSGDVDCNGDPADSLNSPIVRTKPVIEKDDSLRKLSESIESAIATENARNPSNNISNTNIQQIENQTTTTSAIKPYSGCPNIDRRPDCSHVCFPKGLPFPACGIE